MKGKRRILFGHSGRVWDVAFSPRDCNILASGSDDKTLRIWNIDGGREVHTFSIPEPIWTVAFAPNGEFVAAGSGTSRYGAARLWGIEKGELLRTFYDHIGSIKAITISPDSTTIASGSS